MSSRSPKLGYVLALSAATLRALTGSPAKFLLDDHMPAARLAQLRAAGTFAAIAAGLAVWRPRLLIVRRPDIPRLALLGVIGLSGVTAFYFAAIRLGPIAAAGARSRAGACLRQPAPPEDSPPGHRCSGRGGGGRAATHAR